MSSLILPLQAPQAEFTLEEVADRLGYSAGHLRRLERDRLVPPARRVGSSRMRIYNDLEIDSLRSRLNR